MIDINFYMISYDLIQKLQHGDTYSKNEVLQRFEEFRSEEPVVYNIETTNNCNMRCKMCPRTTMMTRPVESMDLDDFQKIVDQLRPWKPEEWSNWVQFVQDKYGIREDEMSENHFFLYIIPKVIQLHGYGDPLLDKYLDKNVKLLNHKGFFSYFSCNPANINVERTAQMFANGLDYLKFSIETVDDEKHKEIRGNASNFSESYENILELLEIKKENQYKVTIVITMLDLNREKQKEDYDKLKEYFAGLDVYIYLKSEDQQWYRKDYHGTQSVHWSEICKHPWMSMTIKSNCEVAMCMEDYDNEIILGNTKDKSLREIWNGTEYETFRHDHVFGKREHKCHDECDMSLVSDFAS